MMSFPRHRPAAAALTALGLFAVALAASGQPPRPGTQPTPLDVAKTQQAIAEKKVESEVLKAIEDAERLARANHTAKAVQYLKSARGNVAFAVGISEGARDRFTRLLDAKIAVLEGRPLPAPTPGVVLDPKGPDVKAAKKQAFDAYVAELKDVNEGIDRINKAAAAGDTARVNAEIARLARLYPSNPAVAVLTQNDSIKGRVADAVALQRQMDDRMWKLQKQSMQATLPAVRDIEFPDPKEWKELTARRLGGQMQLTAKEKKILEALDKGYNINFRDRPLEEALQDLSNMLDVPLLVDRKSLDDLGLDLKKGATLQANGLSGRTILRAVLATQGLTFVVKDESIQIVTVDRARSMLTTRAYYIGDIAQSGPFSGPQWGPIINGMAAAENGQMIVDTIIKSIDPLMWDKNGGPGSVVYHFPSQSIIVRASSEVHFQLGRGFGGRK